MDIMKLKNINKTFENDGVKTVVLNNITFNIQKGEFVSIIGASGSGKSTLLQVLGFLDKHTKGEYLFEGKSIEEYNEEDTAHIRNKKMGFIFQTFNLLSRNTVYENIKLPLLYSAVPEIKWDKLTLDAISAVGLSHRKDHNSTQLSGGERQRVAIARALVNNPDIIFADEPTGNLDSKSGEQVMRIISKLHKEGHTILLITHESYTANYADRIITLHDGKVVSDKINKRANRYNEHFVK